jgi:hydrogenase/urease accessory protein HupE
LAVVCGETSQAHEVRPGYLEIVQPGQDSCRVVWKRPMMGELALRLVPRLSTGWLDRSPDDQYASAGFLILTWHIRPCADNTLAGMTVTVEGLDQTITDVFVRVQLWNGWQEDAVLRPDSTRFELPAGFHGSSGVPGYLKLGVDHILSGVDHLLFVLGLILLIRDRWMLLKAVTAFTVAHSITLACVLLMGWSLPGGFVEILISLSILFLGAEVLQARRGGASLTIRFPWATAFLFGLFHGMGFAGGLAELGYAKQDLAAALVFFNLGVELGQIGFIGVVLLLAWLTTKQTTMRAITRTEAVARIPAWLVGTAGAFWTFQTGMAWLEGR